ncbi:MAG: GMC family oxidoreductase N-terminal domain-containing protein, partial [Pseudomonadales bacterium]|nr:GMC family oxidoreductase N-terminal domain-containing protein [Pseudomonadales bacterium]
MDDPDYIVIGAGSAGCVVANRLVEAGNSVLLLEAGRKPHRWDYRIHMPAALSDVLAGDAYNWYYRTDPEPWMDHRLMYCPRGRALGGSSSINGMIYVRGNPEDFNRWARQTGYPEWDYEGCLPWFMKAESAVAGTYDCRGREGPLHVTRGELRNPLFRAFIEAGVEAGYPANDDLNGPVQE